MNGTAIAHLYGLDAGVVRKNLDGVTEEEAFAQPPGGGNCMNWILGHIVTNRQNALALIGRESVIDARITARYERGTQPVLDAAGGVAGTDELLSALGTTQELLDGFLREASDEALAAPLPDGTSPVLGKTLGQALAALAWHEGYHAGQLGILRRMAGRAGAIR